MRSAVPGLLVALALALAALPLLADEPQRPPAPPQAAEPDIPAGPDTPAGPDRDARVDQLVRDLGSPEFVVREQARKALLEIGEPARAALEKTMNESQDMEARWRAEQILRRLDHEKARPVHPGQPPRPGQAPGVPAPPPPRLGTPLPPGAPDPRGEHRSPAERLFEELIRRMETGRGPGAPGGRNTVRLEAPGLELEVSTFSILPRVQLQVGGHAQPYSGRSLDELLVRYPDLAKHPGMPLLRKKWAEHLESRPSPFGLDPRAQRGLGFRSFVRSGRKGEGVEITSDGEKVHVRVTETDENGQESVKEYDGASIEEILEQQPELEGRLGGIQIEFGRPSPRFFGRPGGQRLPVPPAPRAARPPVVTPGESGSDAFGAVVESPEPVLAAHLGIPAGRGALVRQVIAGSQAEVFGLKRYDVILLVDGETVTDVPALTTLLRQKARDRAPFTMTVIRRGERVPLSR